MMTRERALAIWHAAAKCAGRRYDLGALVDEAQALAAAGRTEEYRQAIRTIDDVAGRWDDGAFVGGESILAASRVLGGDRPYNEVARHAGAGVAREVTGDRRGRR